MVKRVRLGRIYAHAITFDGALDAVAGLVDEGNGGFVVTPNVDHVVQAEHDDALVAAYDAASLSLVDGQPLMWLSRLMAQPFPEKISGSDFVPRLLTRAATAGWRVAFVGAAQGVGEEAARVLRNRLPDLDIVTTISPPFGFDEDEQASAQVVQKVVESRPDLVIMALGCPKQELLMHRWKKSLAPAVAIGSGATLDFIAGHVPRAPAWMSDAGLEWLFRLAREPRRLGHRYLVRDPEIVRVAWRMLRLPPEARVLEKGQAGGR